MIYYLFITRRKNGVRFIFVRERDAYVAQLVERILGKDEVPGSIPGVGSTLLESYNLTFKQ